MVIAVVAVGVVQVALHQVIHVVAMRDCFVPAARAVLMARLVRAAVVVRSASGRVSRAHRQDVFVDVIAVGVMQVPIVQVILVVIVQDCRVTAAGTVLVGMLTVLLTLAHGFLPGPSARLLPFAGMLEYSVDQLDDVLVGQRVKDMLSFAVRNDQALGSEDPELL